MLTTTSAPWAASAGESATGPTPRASALLLVRSQTETSKPPFFNRRAIAPPIFPVPSTATLVVIRQPPVLALPLTKMRLDEIRNIPLPVDRTPYIWVRLET